MKRQPRRKTIKVRFKIRDEDAAAVFPSMSYEGAGYDIMLHAAMAKITLYISPASLGLALYDWIAHLAISPAKRIDLIRKLTENLQKYAMFAQNKMSLNPYGHPEDFTCIPRANDNRFKYEGWSETPFCLYSQAFLAFENWWNKSTSNISGVSKHHEHVLNFAGRQILDIFSPSNYPFTNPEVIDRTIKCFGLNFLEGYNNFLEDTYRTINKLPPVGMEKFPVGEKVAVTPGKVIYRNHLIELIQYEPTTRKVYPEPILIIPAWIMKYYILDLSPHNSLVRYLVEKGHTVFMISWKNPTQEDRNLGLEDYLNLGIMSSLSAINSIIPDRKIHATGYCLGGTLLMIAAAVMAAIGDERIKTISLFAAQVDFRDPGEMSLFIDQSQISYLEDVMREKGYLDGNQMSGAFSMLRSNDLIWSRMVHDYLLGKRRPMNDLMAWDHDTTRLPYRMHTEYLRNLFLNNDLVQGRYAVGGRRIALTDIKQPIFAVGTVKDHVSPWRSVYRVTLFTTTDVTFVLTNGGHNAGIVSEPGHKGRQFQMATHMHGEKHISADNWVARTPKYDGSWWPAWEEWITLYSGNKVKPPQMGNPKADYTILCDAPGTYVFQH